MCKKMIFGIAPTLLFCLVTGCAADYEVALGSSVDKMRAEQTLNPKATQDNLGYVPTGSGERMQSTLDVYHKQTASMENNSTISIDNILAMPVNNQ